MLIYLVAFSELNAFDWSNNHFDAYFQVTKTNDAFNLILQKMPTNHESSNDYIIDLDFSLNALEQDVHLFLRNLDIVYVEFNVMKDLKSNQIYFDLFILDNQSQHLTIRNINLVNNINLDQNQISNFSSHNNASKEDPILKGQKINLKMLYMDSNKLRSLRVKEIRIKPFQTKSTSKPSQLSIQFN